MLRIVADAAGLTGDRVTGPRFVAEAMPSVAMEGFAIVWHEPSGTTHLLASPVPEILATMTAAPATVDEIVERLRADYELDGDGAAAVTAHIAELDALGLVRRA